MDRIYRLYVESNLLKAFMLLFQAETIPVTGTVIAVSHQRGLYLIGWFDQRFRSNAAKLLNPDRTVVLITGDGAMGCTGQEMETAARCELNVITIVLNDSGG